MRYHTYTNCTVVSSTSLLTTVKKHYINLKNGTTRGYLLMLLNAQTQRHEYSEQKNEAYSRIMTTKSVEKEQKNIIYVPPWYKYLRLSQIATIKKRDCVGKKTSPSCYANLEMSRVLIYSLVRNISYYYKE